MSIRSAAFLLPLLAFALAAPVQAEPTAMTVRVIARDAKFIGTGMGGVRVTLRDARSGKVLASGVTAGGTGDTDRIMHASGRSPMRGGEGVAAFATSIDIDQPTMVELVAEGPLGHAGSALRATQQRWIMPGEAETIGEGWTIELPGLVISPTMKVGGGKATIEAKVELMCGCPITPGGLWDSADYSVRATLWHRGKAVAASDLAFVQAPGGYRGEIALPGRGSYRLTLFARNRRTGNSGLAEVRLVAPAD